MKRNIKYSIIGLSMVLTGMWGCNNNDLEVSPVISTEDYPIATFTTDFTGTSVEEGDTIVYTITFDKMLDRDIDFAVMLKGGTADEADFETSPVVLAAYTLSVDIQIVFTTGAPEFAETIELEIGASELANKFFVNPKTENAVLNLTINNYYNPDALLVAMGWPNEENDIDIFAFSEADEFWGYSASSDNPEIIDAIWPTDPDGVYKLTFDPYHVEGNSFEYIISIGKPDGSVEVFEGVYDLLNPNNATYYWADEDWTLFHILDIAKSGETFTITHLN